MRILPLLFLFISASNLLAQYVPMDIPLVKNGTPLKNPWAGGLNLPQFSEVDLNNDGIKDLVTFDREGFVMSTFINGGTPGLVDYTYAPEYMKHLPQDDAINFMLFRDYNCDGIEDIFGMYTVWGQGVGVAIWRGSYDANDTIQYTLVEDQLRYDVVGGGPFDYKMFIYNTDLPAIDDIDGDGDMDILAFTLDICFPKNVFWYKNMSVENGHNCDSLDFVLESECWGLFEETGDSSILNFGPSTDSCYNNAWFNQIPLMPRADRIRGQHSTVGSSRGPRHVGANTTTVDFNGDGVRDMALGGVTYKNVNMVSGVMINDTILITTQDYHYPVYDEPVDIYTFPGTFFLDVNNDGLTDMIAAPSETGISESVMDSVAWYYQNTGSNNNMIFDFQQKDFLVGEMLDVGRRAFPALFDYNGDGIMDMLIGGYGRCQDGGSYEYGMTLLENTGTLTAPSFEYVTNNYAGTDSLQLNGLYPTFGDMDGDNDVDMICGAQDGTLIYFENTAGVGNPVAWAAPVRNYSGIDVGDASAPHLVDLDRDADLDLVVGRFAGYIHYYENKGTASSPSFNSYPITYNLGGYNIDTANSRHPLPFVYDNNGSYEMYIGHQEGNIIHLGNIDGNILGVYDTLSENFNDFYQGRYTHMSIADLDNDNKLDYILGTGRGGVMIMVEKDTVVNTPTVKLEQKVVYLFPNPAQDELTISFLETNQGALNLTVYNALGQLVMQRNTTTNSSSYQLDISTLPAGVLFLDIQTDDYHEVVRFVKR
ncbi:T9SS type A sorting domain-containing protein [Aureispira anguillae]|uniref:T9SS type A sorting domain-containing protein n=1 Tax=Aureispira anguillae TaxID=2864201 RepID=A0A915YBA8_9BACT|nr:T9SS type A sorting domain-containing protein [Aureispira anguillae]BDS09922.1 T9SS type A sorting domain-containing protein [Aureispira anguillae]